MTEARMFSHIHVGVADVQRALAFYAPVMEALGCEHLPFPADDWHAWREPGSRRPFFMIGRPFDRLAPSPGNGQMTAFLAPDRPTVDRCHALALAGGGTSEGEPGLRPHYHPHYYGAYVRDPDGNKLCVCCHDPASPDDLRPESR